MSYFASAQSTFTSIEGKAQGTTYHIIYKSKNGQNLKNDVDSILTKIDFSLSTYNPKSTISRINNNDSEIRCDSIFNELFDHARYMNVLSGGDFDITGGPLVRLWGFGSSRKSNITTERIDSILRLTGMDKIKLNNCQLIKNDPGIRLDVNAIAQGFSVDLLSRHFDKIGIKRYSIELGGEVKVKGKNTKGKRWKIGVDKPIDDNDAPGENLQNIFSIKNKSLSTSGNYRNYIIENGIKYGHHIDPKTGYPAKNSLLSVTIIATDCFMADALATACLVKGLEKSIIFINSLENIEAYFIYSGDKGEFKEYFTNKAKNMLYK